MVRRKRCNETGDKYLHDMGARKLWPWRRGGEAEDREVETCRKYNDDLTALEDFSSPTAARIRLTAYLRYQLLDAGDGIRTWLWKKDTIPVT